MITEYDLFEDLLYLFITFVNFCTFIYIFKGVLKVYKGIGNLIERVRFVVYGHPSIHVTFKSTLACLNQYDYHLRQGLFLDIKDLKQKLFLVFSIFFLIVLKVLLIRVLILLFFLF